MKRFSLRAQATLAWVAIGVFGISCLGTSDDAENRNGALTSAQQDILGFEQPNLWSSPTGPVATLSTDHTQGLKSLQVTPSHYVPYTSKPMSSLGPVGQTLFYDLKLPTQQKNPHWFGASQIFVSIPSRGVYNAFVGQVELTGLPLNVWTTLSFTLKPALVQTLGTTTYTDLTFTIVLNVPANAQAIYLLDNVRFSPAPTDGGQGTGGQGTGGRGTGGQGTGGQGTGGQGTGGQGTGGRGTGGQGTGGQGTGGQGTGGQGTGGRGTGGQGTGGQGTGGQGTGGQGTGGQGTGGQGTGGQGTGGQGTGGQGTGGQGTGGQGTGGQGTGGRGTGGQGTGGQGTGGQGTGGQGGTCVPTHCPGPVCDQCQVDNCVPDTDGCDGIADPADRALCENVYSCFVNPASACLTAGGAGDPLKCWCGTNPTTCVSSNVAPTKANGPCLEAIIQAAHLTDATYDAATIKQRFVDPTFPLGRAVNLSSCEGNFCNVECGIP